jgi:hypothetical protein
VRLSFVFAYRIANSPVISPRSAFEVHQLRLNDSKSVVVSHYCEMCWEQLSELSRSNSYRGDNHSYVSDAVHAISYDLPLVVPFYGTFRFSTVLLSLMLLGRECAACQAQCLAPVTFHRELLAPVPHRLLFARAVAMSALLTEACGLSAPTDVSARITDTTTAMDI